MSGPLEVAYGAALPMLLVALTVAVRLAAALAVWREHLWPDEPVQPEQRHLWVDVKFRRLVRDAATTGRATNVALRAAGRTARNIPVLMRPLIVQLRFSIC